MARSSTTYRPKWRLGNTTVVRVPQSLAPAVLRYAHELDDKTGPEEIHDGNTPQKWMNMNRTEKLTKLRSFQAKCDAIRQEFEISPPGRLLFLASPDAISADMVVVEADGYGSATTSVIDGNYPVDYITKFERSFPTEDEAVASAELLAFQGANPSQVLDTLE